jgi:hypothetical protein
MSVECDTTDTGDSELPHSENAVSSRMVQIAPNEYQMIEFSFVTNPVYPWAVIRIKWYRRLWWKILHLFKQWYRRMYKNVKSQK